MSYFVDMYKRYVDFTGRATRKEFWCAYGIWIAIYLVLYIIAIATGGAGAISGTSGASAIGTVFLIIVVIFALASIVPVLAIQVRRLRDAGFQWWVLLLCYVGSILCGIGSLVLLVLLCMPTKEPENQY